jgi:hypothetical protein
MNKAWKQALKEAYRPPEPTGKEAFLRQHRRRELSGGEFLLTQAGYIRWWVWAGSLLLFALVLLMIRTLPAEEIWCASALTPFLALLTVVENHKSALWGMEELERACRIPLRSVVLTRMTLLGVFHLLLLTVLTPVLALSGSGDVVRAGVYLLTPYLLTAVLGMEVTRHVQGQEAVYACVGLTALVSGLGLAGNISSVSIYQRSYFPRWEGVAAVLIVAAAIEFYQLMRRMEAA